MQEMAEEFRGESGGEGDCSRDWERSGKRKRETGERKKEGGRSIWSEGRCCG